MLALRVWRGSSSGSSDGLRQLSGGQTLSAHARAEERTSEVSEATGRVRAPPVSRAPAVPERSGSSGPCPEARGDALRMNRDAPVTRARPTGRELRGEVRQNLLPTPSA